MFGWLRKVKKKNKEKRKKEKVNKDNKKWNNFFSCFGMRKSKKGRKV